MHVRAVFQPPEGPAVESVFDIPAAAPIPSTTRVAHVYPSTNVLPANALKLYVYFDAPMRKGDSWKHLHLLRDGAPVAYPFLELDQELWDRDQRASPCSSTPAASSAASRHSPKRTRARRGAHVYPTSAAA